MNVKTYNYDDLRPMRNEEPWAFIDDIPGSNPDLLDDMDNHELKSRLDKYGLLIEGVVASCETCCSYYYFASRRVGETFIDKLNAYLLEKARLTEAARSL